MYFAVFRYIDLPISYKIDFFKLFFLTIMVKARILFDIILSAEPGSPRSPQYGLQL